MATLTKTPLIDVIGSFADDECRLDDILSTTDIERLAAAITTPESVENAITTFISDEGFGFCHILSLSDIRRLIETIVAAL